MADLHEDIPVEEETPPKRILFLGDENVGKTTFIKSYCEHMRDHYGCDFYEGIFLVFTQFLLYRERFGRRVPIRFLDLPAGATEDSLRDQYPSKVNLIVLCFAIDNLTSLANVWQIWLPEFRQYYPKSTRFYLLGLKCDTRREMLVTGRIPVTIKRGLQVHQRHAFSGDYLECSVQGNPEQARHCMDTLFNDAYLSNPPRLAY